MIAIAPELIAAALPLLVSVPTYILGRKLFFKGIPQSDMHKVRLGRLFTLAVFGVHLALTVGVYVWLFW